MPGGQTMKYHHAPWSPLLKTVSWLSTGLLLAIGLIPWLTGMHLPAFLHWGIILLPVIILLVCACFTVRGYTLGTDAILIQRLFWSTRLPRAGLQAARFEPGVMRSSLRTCGNGGLFSFSGYYRNQRLGSYRAWVTDLSRTVVLQYANHTVVVSPESPEDFVRELSETAG
jgi:Bacterial PH domain